MKKCLVVMTILALVAVLAAGCTGAESPLTSPTPSPTPGPTTQTSGTGFGAIEVRVTDAPPGYEIISIVVTVSEEEGEGVKARRAVDDGEDEWETIDIIEDNNPFDLTQLEDGLQTILAMAEVPAGKYTQIRMNIASVVVTYLKDGDTEETTVKATLPSGQLKFVRPFDVVKDETTIILLDFIADKSVTVTGKGDVIFKPVVKLLVSGKGKPIKLGYSLETTGDATAELSDEPAHSGEESVHLETTGTEGDGNEARIVIPLPEGTTLGDIDSISWWVWTVAGYPPHVDIVMDVDEDGELDDEDMLTAEMAYNNAEGIELDEGLTPIYDEWLQTFELTSDDGYGEIGDDTMLWVTKMGAGSDDAPWLTLADWKDGVVVPNDPGDDGLAAGVIDGNAPVLRLEIEIDNWVLQTEAYVDDIEIVIGGVTYTVGL